MKTISTAILEKFVKNINSLTHQGVHDQAVLQMEEPKPEKQLAESQYFCNIIL